MKRFLVTAGIVLSCVLLQASGRVTGSFHFNEEGLSFFRAQQQVINGKKTFEIADITYDRGVDHDINDLTLSFNNTPMRMDDSRKYAVYNAQFEHRQGAGYSGGGAAYFFKKEHRIEIENKQHLWMGETEDLGSFTIEFKFMPSSFTTQSLLLSRVGYNTGLQNGVQIYLKNNRIVTSFYNAFYDERGDGHSVTIAGSPALRKDKWYHYAISYDRLSGRLAAYLDGEALAVQYMTEGSSAQGTVYTPRFAREDLPDIVIGERYFGAIDELRISYRDLASLAVEKDISVPSRQPLGGNERKPANNEGVITSPVYEFPATGTMIHLFSWKEFPEPETFVYFELRISDDRFNTPFEQPRWYRIENNQRNIYLMKQNDLFLRGRYFQWRAHLIASPDGKTTPHLYDIMLDYEVDTPPTLVQGVEVAAAGDRFIKIRWLANSDHDILGYKLYYGVKKGEYTGLITRDKGARISNNGRYVELVLDNSLVDENRASDTTRYFEFPEIKNNILYFISVTAYDSYRPDTKYNHESSFSKELSARPFAGSEITRQ